MKNAMHQRMDAGGGCTGCSWCVHKHATNILQGVCGVVEKTNIEFMKIDILSLRSGTSHVNLKFFLKTLKDLRFYLNILGDYFGTGGMYCLLLNNIKIINYWLYYHKINISCRMFLNKVLMLFDFLKEIAL